MVLPIFLSPHEHVFPEEEGKLHKERVNHPVTLHLSKDNPCERVERSSHMRPGLGLGTTPFRLMLICGLNYKALFGLHLQ